MKTLFGLPEEVKFCKACVVSNQRPDSTIEFANKNKKTVIHFDQEGLCSACRWSEIKYNEMNWQQKEEELIKLLDRHRSNGARFDVVVPGSGGKDSIFVAMELQEKYGMTPLTVTWPPNIYTDIGRQNFQAWLDMGSANVSVSPSRTLHRRITREAFKNLCHPFQPFILGQKRIGVQIALDYGIPLVMYGESHAEGGTDINEALNPKMPLKYFSKKNNMRKDLLLGGVHYKDWLKRGVGEAELSMYIPASEEEVLQAGVEVHYYSYYTLWRPQEHYYHVVQNTNFKPNPVRTEGTYSKYSSLDDKVDGFHYFTTFIKFGIGRATYDAAQEIRNRHLTREEGVSLVQKYDGEFPKKYFEEFLDYCSLTEGEFWEIIDKNRSPHLWKKEGGQWQLRHQIE